MLYKQSIIQSWCQCQGAPTLIRRHTIYHLGFALYESTQHQFLGRFQERAFKGRVWEGDGARRKAEGMGCYERTAKRGRPTGANQYKARFARRANRSRLLSGGRPGARAGRGGMEGPNTRAAVCKDRIGSAHPGGGANPTVKHR